ncbi:peptidase [Streptomyces gamaensis]|uniref:Peptidase n=1 Tax=Streptomyces gamaensis TaxID=1763542 RepID=A0ABW0Z6I5_9ACTN
MFRDPRHPVIRHGTPALAALLAGGALLLAAPPAAAESVDVNYQCKTPIGDKSAVSPIDIKAEPSGDTYKLTVIFGKGVSSSPIELPKGVMKPSAVVKLGGDDSGTVPVEGPANDAAIPPNTPIKINDLSGTYTPKKSGKVTFTASVLTIAAMGTTTTCTPSNNPKPSLTLDVKAPGGSSGGSGGSSSGSTSGSSSGSTSGSSSGTNGSGGSGSSGGTGGTGSTGGTGGTSTGGDTGGTGTTGAGSTGGKLPQTGPSDSAIALGTLGGTLLLSGVGGALWLTRRHRPADPR